MKFIFWISWFIAMILWPEPVNAQTYAAMCVATGGFAMLTCDPEPPAWQLAPVAGAGVALVANLLLGFGPDHDAWLIPGGLPLLLLPIFVYRLYKLYKEI